MHYGIRYYRKIKMAFDRERKLPDFLGIGAQRSGSTWLYANLKQHPEIWMSPIKEVNFWGNNKHWKRKWKIYRTHAARRMANYFLSSKVYSPAYRNLFWDYHYFFKKRDLSWYRGIFRPKAGQLTGEITPGYSEISEQVVQKIYAANPAMRIIYFMRDPTERVWSSVVKNLARDKRKRIEVIPQDVLRKKLVSKSTQDRGNYIRALNVWGSIFPPEQIHIDFMDEIRESPREVLLRVYRFLGVDDNEKHVPADVAEKKNSTDGYKIPIPAEMELLLAETYLPELKMLNQRFGGHTTTWLHRAQSILYQAEASQENDYL